MEITPDRRIDQECPRIEERSRHAAVISLDEIRTESPAGEMREVERHYHVALRLRFTSWRTLSMRSLCVGVLLIPRHDAMHLMRARRCFTDHSFPATGSSFNSVSHSSDCVCQASHIGPLYPFRPCPPEASSRYWLGTL